MSVQQRLGLIFLFGFLLIAARVGFSNVSAQSNQEPSFQERYPRYRLRAGDVLELNFPFSPEFNQSVGVQPDGYINLRGIGEIRVQDKTTPEVVESLRTAYSKILHEPVIHVELKEFEKPYFLAGGEFARPGKYELRVRTVDKNGFAQPEPRPNQRSGKNRVRCKLLEVN